MNSQERAVPWNQLVYYYYYYYSVVVVVVVVVVGSRVFTSPSRPDRLWDHPAS
jgi:hypothetical protein